MPIRFEDSLKVVDQLAMLSRARVISYAYARDALQISTCAHPDMTIQEGFTGGRAKCAHCGQWGERFCECSKCGAPVD